MQPYTPFGFTESDKRFGAQGAKLPQAPITEFLQRKPDGSAFGGFDMNEVMQHLRAFYPNAQDGELSAIAKRQVANADTAFQQANSPQPPQQPKRLF